MRNYLSLAGIQSKTRRRQNRMTIFCIVLAVFLVTGVFTMADMGARMEYARQIKKNGEWHIMLKNCSEEEMASIKAEQGIHAAVRYDVLNYGLENDYFIGNKKVAITGTEPEIQEIIPGLKLVGEMPKGPEKITLSSNAQSLFQIDMGDEVTLQTPGGNFTYKVSGFVQDDSWNLAHDGLSAVISMEAFEDLCKTNGVEMQTVQYIKFEKNREVKKNIKMLQEKYGLSQDDISQNAAVMGYLGLSDNSYIVGLYGTAAFLMILVIMAGVLMISGSMNSNISRQTQFFGMLRCIGASKKQIKHIVIREALCWCSVAIPIGEIAAILTTWGICAVMHYGIGGEFQEMPVFQVSMVGIVVGVAMGMITVILAADAPARKAAKVSPVMAVSGNPANGGKIRTSANTRFYKVDTAMGIRHAVSSKKNLFLITGSFALSIVLFLCFSIMIDWIGYALNTLKPYTPHASVSDPNRENTISKDMADEIASVYGVDIAYGRMYQQLDVVSDKDVKRADLISYDDRQFEWSKEDLLSGDLSAVQEKTDCVMIVFEKDNPLTCGDTLVINGEELQVAAALSDSPFGTSDIPTLICSEETFERITGITNYAVLDLQFSGDAKEDIMSEIRTIAGESYNLGDYRESNREINSTYYAFSFLVYSFLAVIALITVFNIINCIAVSVSSRMNQFGMMRAVGMGRNQLIKMIFCEASSYAVCGCLVGCGMGIPIHKALFQRIITHYFGTAWVLPKEAMVIILLLVIGSAVAAVYRPFKQISSMNITDVINTLG
ncbi:MAG: ABC transporter permease [Lachnospiraceae bacterium]